MPPSRVRPPLRRAPGESARRVAVPTSDARDRAAGDAGFTIVEALVSLVLLAVMATASTTAVVAATKTSKNSTDRVNAANIAQQDLQAARALRWPNYPAAIPARGVTIGTTTYTVTRTVALTTLPAGTVTAAGCPATPNYTTNPYMTVTSTVTWPAPPSAAASAKVVMSTELAC